MSLMQLHTTQESKTTKVETKYQVRNLVPQNR